MVYLVHFGRKLKHAQHYIGYTNNLLSRIRRHVRGDGSKLFKAFIDNKISFIVVRVWLGVDRKFERKLKNRKNTPKFCPICNPNYGGVLK